jgi:hypothetical protein
MTGAARTPEIAYAIDPRFPGGTSSAIAQELAVVSQIARPKIYAISSKMFNGATPAPQIEKALNALNLDLEWDPPTIAADVLILHNPSFLRFSSEWASPMVANHLFVVTHENFARPGGQPAFDVHFCLDLIDRNCLALNKTLAPISAHNRKTVTGWLAGNKQDTRWSVLDNDWFNICQFEMCPPTTAPADRRGRLSRPGYDKFPPLDDLELSFPPPAEKNLILGADTLMTNALDHPHWELVPFGGMEVGTFFEAIDFMVYFTSPAWRESFGRVLAEAMAAGKVVITDERTASSFGNGVIAARPNEVGAIIGALVENPRAYGAQVRRGQKTLEKFSASAFRTFFMRHVLTNEGSPS